MASMQGKTHITLSNPTGNLKDVACDGYVLLYVDDNGLHIEHENLSQSEVVFLTEYAKSIILKSIMNNIKEEE